MIHMSNEEEQIIESKSCRVQLELIFQALIIVAVYRFGQMLQAARCAKSRVDEDLVLLINQLPYNRLVNIILANIR